jgi:hypothetical protein
MKNDNEGVNDLIDFIVESARDVPYGDINLQEFMYFLPTILPCSLARQPFPAAFTPAVGRQFIACFPRN